MRQKVCCGNHNCLQHIQEAGRDYRLICNDDCLCDQQYYMHLDISEILDQPRITHENILLCIVLCKEFSAFLA